MNSRLDSLIRTADPILLGVLVGGLILCAALLPAKIRVPASLAFMALWLSIGRMPDLGRVADLARATSGLGFAVVAVGAWFAPGNKRALPQITYAYPALGLASVLFVATASDALKASALRLQWVLLCLAVLAVARTVVDADALRSVLKGIFIGTSASVAVAAMAVAADPGAAINAFGRFVPFGVNPNQIGEIFYITVPLGLYFALRQRGAMAVVYWLITAASSALGLLTGSRALLIIVFISVAPVLVQLTGLSARRVITGAAAAVLLSGIVLAVVPAADLGRLLEYKPGDASRFDRADEYIEAISDRPLTGLLLTDGRSSAWVNRSFSHNGYLSILYTGGLLIAVPTFYLMARSAWIALLFVRLKVAVQGDRLLMTLLVGFLIAGYVHAALNTLVVHPTYSWAFLNVLLSVLFLTWHRGGIDAQRGPAAGQLPEPAYSS